MAFDHTKFRTDDERALQPKIDSLNKQFDIGIPVTDCSIAWNPHCINVYLLFQKQLLPNPLTIANMSPEEQKEFRAEWDNVLAAQLYFTPYHFKTVLTKMTQILSMYEKTFGEIAEVMPEGMQ